MKTQIVDLACGFAALFLVSPAFGQFEKANQEYGAGQFKEAAADYEALTQKGEYSANLFYDMGNTYFRTQDFGKAILNYERALALDRHHPEAEANLRIARDEARALELQPTVLERFLRFGSANEYTILAAIGFWSFIFGVGHLVFGRQRKLATTALSILALSMFVLGAVAVYALEYGSDGQALAIVTLKGVQARVATADSANSVLALPPGSEVTIVSERGDWAYAKLPNNLRGWIPAKSAELVRL